MKKQLLLSILATICCFSVNAQDCVPFQWANRAGGTVNDCGYSVSTDTSGNVYVTGYFNGTASFGTTTLTSAGGSDIFIAKYDAAGNILWAKQAGGTGVDIGFGVNTDAAGNVYVTGYFVGTATFGTATLTSVGNDDIFIAKYDASGNVLWAKQAGGTGWDYGRSVSTDILGNTYITGYFDGTAWFGTTTLTSLGNNPSWAGNYCIYIAKLDANGNFLWAEQAGGASGAFGYGISSDAAGNSYITGIFGGTAPFGTFTLSASGGRIFIAKYDALGNILWAKQAGGTGSDYGNGVSTDALGNAYITGYFNGTASFGTTTLTPAGSNDIFIAKLDANGNFLWAKQAGGTNTEVGQSVSSDASGNAYITGYFVGTAIFGTDTLTSAGNPDIYIAKLDANGNFLWTKRAGGGGTNTEIGQSVSSDASGNVYITGSLDGTAAFGTTTLTSAGNQDMFIAKLSNVSSSISVNSGSVCAGSSFTITPSGASTYTITGGNFTVNPNGTTSYSVTGTDANGCVSANTAVTEITVHALPILNVTGGSTICVNESANLTVNGANTYTWSTNENGTNISVSPSVTTNYSVQGMDNNGCSNSTNVTVNVDECLGIGELKIENEELKIYPNPVSSVLNVEFLVLSSVEVEIKVIDVLGREILIKQLATRNGTVQINVSEIPKGIYFIKIGNETRKFVKE